MSITMARLLFASTAVLLATAMVTVNKIAALQAGVSNPPTLFLLHIDPTTGASEKVGEFEGGMGAHFGSKGKFMAAFDRHMFPHQPN